MRAGDLGRRAARSSTHPEPWSWWSWVLTFLSYVVLGYLLKSVVLNWIVGPLYPLFVMYVLPTTLRGLLGGRVAVRPLAQEPEAPT